MLATNTSSLSVTEMAADLEHPERVVGMHFFNPVAVMPLVELIRHRRDRRRDARDRLRRRRRRCASAPVLVRDAPGFVVNRVLTRLTSVVIDALEHGNTVDETDEAILRLGLPMAPSVLLQMVGPRVANHVLETLHEAFPERFPLSPTLAQLRRGPRRDRRPRGAAPQRGADPRRRAGGDRGRDRGTCSRRASSASAKDVDTALLLGAGFPFWLGGITKYLDQTGVSERVVGRPLAEVGAAGRA